MLTIKLILLLLPFIKEVFFGKTSARETFRTHKRRIIILLVFLLSVWINIELFTKSVRLSYQIVKLESKNNELETKIDDMGTTISNLKSDIDKHEVEDEHIADSAYGLRLTREAVTSFSTRSSITLKTQPVKEEKH